jgi:terminase large subunit-like protein
VTSHSNIRQIVFPRIDSEYRIATAGDPNAGRGMTIHNLHCSEVARWLGDGQEVLASLRAAVPANGNIVLESTPNGAAGIFYDEWQRAEETGYTRHFFPWWYDESSVETAPICLGELTPEEEDLARRFDLTQGQIAWRRAKFAEMRGLAIQEYAEDPTSCFLASGECVFDLQAIDKLLAFSGEPLEMLDNKRLMIWLPVQSGKEYIMGVDPAGGGTDGDYSCAEVVDRQSGMQCAELHGHFAPRELALKLISLSAIYNQALVVVERNNHGHAVLAHLREREFADVYVESNKDGWLTSAVTRPAMIENLAASLVAAPGIFRSPRLLKECRTFVRHADGRSEAAAGAHDDCVMAMAIALAARRKMAGQTRNDGAVEMSSLPRLV